MWVGMIALVVGCASAAEPAEPVVFDRRHLIDPCIQQCEEEEAAMREVLNRPRPPRPVCMPPRGKAKGALRVFVKDPNQRPLFLASVSTQCRGAMADIDGEVEIVDLVTGIFEVTVSYRDVRQTHQVVIVAGATADLHVNLDAFEPPGTILRACVCGHRLD